MKSLAKLAGIIAFVAVIGFSFAACEDDALDALDGTRWLATYTVSGIVATATIEFNSPNFTWRLSYNIGGQEQGGTTTGTYTVSGSTVTLAVISPNGQTTTTNGNLSGNTLVINGIEYTKQ